MKSIMKASAIAGIGLSLMLAFNIAFAQTPSLESLAAEWAQWAFSIPTKENPMLDPNGKNCGVGQSGPLWFLAGVFGGGTATRNCSVPVGKRLFFPVFNSIQINTPNICGELPEPLSVGDLRHRAADDIGKVNKTNLLVEIDGQPIENIQYVRSEVFEVTLPEENVFDNPCKDAKLGNVPAGIYSPAVADGFYVLLDPLNIGNHTLHFRAEGMDGSTLQNVTYNLTIR